MRLWTIRIASCLIACTLTAARAEATDPSSPQLVFSRQNGFSIPFKVEEARPGTQTPPEVQLHVSNNRGVTWQIASRVTAGARRFTYRASADGEYWFMVRTLDAAGKLQPDAPPAPELKVLVDTKMPTLEVEAWRGSAGEIHVRWKAIDAALAPESLKISYQPIAGSLGWQPVAIDLQRAQYEGQTYHGETTWWPESCNGPIAIRADIADAAGNRTYSQAEVGPAPESTGPLVERLPIGEPIAAGRPEVSPLPPWQPPAESIPPSASPAEVVAEPAPAPPTMPTAFPISKSTPSAAPTPLREAQSPPPSDVLPLPQVPAPVESTVIAEPPSPAVLQHQELPQREAKPIGQLPEPTPVVEAPVASPVIEAPSVAPPQASRASTPASTPSNSIAPPPGVKPRMVNQTTFEMAYDISAVGPEGLAKVELWGTNDGGRTWHLATIDNDRMSPANVTVQGQGWYGFRIVVESGLGLREPPPLPGELPEVWVVVDTTSPVAKLSIEESHGESRPGVLSIAWEADDESLAPRPISLWFRPLASESWTTLAAGLENTGRYDWQIDRRAPEKVFVRLEVRDEAGNVTTVETPSPISIAHLRPQGRIINVRPAHDAADDR